MSTSPVWRRCSGFLAVVTLALTFAVSPSGLSGAPDDLVTVVGDLNGPRGVSAGPLGSVVYTEIDGTFSAVTTFGRHTGSPRTLGSVPANFIAPAITAGLLGQTYVLTAGGPPGSGAATLYRWLPWGGAPKPVADIAAYQITDPDPYNTDGPPEESNPFGVALLHDGSVLVADAAGNDLLRVFRDGRIITVARLKPRLVRVPEELPDDGFPPAGTPIPAEGVATSVTVGKDGYYYVGELRGFPSTPGTAEIWRIAPNSVNAVCDPAAPRTGRCQRFADGFTSIVSLATGADGAIYVVELVKGGWLQWEAGVVPPIGALYRIPRGGGAKKELAPGQLTLPGGVTVDGINRVYVTSPVFGPGTLSRVRVSH
jgi:hypothetical protein